MKKTIIIWTLIFIGGCSTAQVHEFEENYKHALEEQSYNNTKEYEVEAPKLSDEETKMINDYVK